MKKKKVLICLPSLSNFDGIARVIFNYIDSNLLQRYDIDFLCVKDSIRCSKYNEIVKINNCKVYVLPENKIYNRYFKVKKYLQKYVAINRYDLVHINLIDIYSFACAKTFKKNNATVILHSHNPRFNESRKKIVNYINNISHKNALKYSDYFFSCSDLAGKSSFGDNYKIIPNKADVGKFVFSNEDRENIRKKYNINQECVVFGTVARVTEQKNPLMALEIFKKYNLKNKNSKYIWIGKGNLLEEAKKYCEKESLKDNVLFIKESDNVERYYSAFDLFLLPSKYEGFGNVFLEAQASGLLTFASNMVPKEVNLSKIIKFIDLKESVEDWELKIEKYLDEKIENRIEFNKIIKASIFSLDNKRNELKEAYDYILEEDR